MASSSSADFGVGSSIKDTPCKRRVHIPDSCRGVDIVIGIDEAGRGPVLGSLIYVAAFWPVSEDAEIKRTCDFDDSKKLKEGEREKLLDQVLRHPSIGWVIEELSPVFVSESMLRANPISLNAISYDAVIRALATIRDGDGQPDNTPHVTNVYIDTVGDPEFYKSRLVNALGADYGTFIIEKKADATYKVVGAASIVAKVTRDVLLAQWAWVEPTVTLDKKFGSGYPGDPACVEWLLKAQNNVFGFPNIVRFSWSTARDLMLDDARGTQCCAVQWECDEENDATNGDLTSFFGVSGAKRKRKRVPFFNKMKAKHVYLDEIV